MVSSGRPVPNTRQTTRKLVEAGSATEFFRVACPAVDQVFFEPFQFSTECV